MRNWQCWFLACLGGIGVTAGENMQKRRDEFSKENWLWKTYGLGVLDAKKKQPDRHGKFRALVFHGIPPRG